MSQSFGYTAYIGWKKEVAYGDAATPPNKFLEIESESLKGDPRLKPAKTLGFLSRRRKVKGKVASSGTIRFPFLWTGVEQLIEAAFGAGSLATTGSGPDYTHTFSLKAALHTGLCFHINRDAAALGAGSAFQIAGCLISKFRLIQKVDEPLMVEIDIIGGDRTNVNLTAATFPTFDVAEYGQMSVATIGGASIGFREWQYEIDNMIEPNYRITSSKPAGAHRTDHRLVTFKAQAEFTDMTLYNRFLNMTYAAGVFTWAKGGGSTSTMTINAPNCSFHGPDPETSEPGPYYLEMNAEANYSAADNDESNLVLLNQTAVP